MSQNTDARKVKSVNKKQIIIWIAALVLGAVAAPFAASKN